MFTGFLVRGGAYSDGESCIDVLPLLMIDAPAERWIDGVCSHLRQISNDVLLSQAKTL